MVPPSKHRSSERSYVWVKPLPLNDSDLPLVSLEDLLPFESIGSRLARFLARVETTTQKCQATTTRTAKPNVYVFHEAETIDAIIRDCAPTSIGTRRQCLLELIRRLKKIKPDWSKSEFHEISQKYVANAKGRTRDHSGKETFNSLVWLYDNFESGSGLLEFAESALLTSELVQVPKIFRQNRSQLKACKLATLCRIMHNLSENAVWFLSCRDAARIIGTKSPKHASSYLHALSQVGLIECIDRGTPGKVDGLAASFIWLGEEKEKASNDINEEIPSCVSNSGIAD